MDCPFCGERDFDLLGLKLHIVNRSCEAFEEIDVPRMLRDEDEQRRAAEAAERSDT